MNSFFCTRDDSGKAAFCDSGDVRVAPFVCAKAREAFYPAEETASGAATFPFASLRQRSLSRELLDFFQDAPDTVSAPALVQQRDKLLPEAMEHLFRKFTGTLPSCGTLEGYRLLAVDGSDVKIPPNPADADPYHQGASGQRGYNLLHLNALYDLESRLYQDALVQKTAKSMRRRL